MIIDSKDMPQMWIVNEEEVNLGETFAVFSELVFIRWDDGTVTSRLLAAIGDGRDKLYWDRQKALKRLYELRAERKAESAG